MKTLLDNDTRKEIVQRIEAVSDNQNALWGKMSLGQMLTHAIRVEEMHLGRKEYQRVFMGRLFGKFFLKNAVGNDAPMRRNSPTIPAFKVADIGEDISALKSQWIRAIKEYEGLSDRSIIHPFFGKMSREQIGYHAYKHADHHLRQFNG